MPNEMATPVRVCLIAPVPPPYGGVAHWTRLVMAQASKDRRVDLHVINTASSARLADGRGWFDRIVRQGVHMVRDAGHLRHLLKADTSDVVHLATAGQLGLIRDLLFMNIARHHQVPVVYHLHFGRLPELADRRGPEWCAFARSLRRAAVVVALDHATEETVRSALPATRVIRIPNPIDLAVLPRPGTGSPRTVAFLGWVTPSKGIEDLLDAWPDVRAEHPDWNLEIIGPCEPHYLDSLTDRFDTAGVVFTGELPHAEALRTLAKASILVLPSHTEAFPYAVLEAMALAKPVVAARVGAIPEILAGGCGALVDPHDPRGLAHALSALASSSRRDEMGRLARERVSADYRVEKVFEDYLSIWTTLSRAEVRT